MIGQGMTIMGVTCPNGIETAILGCTDIWGILALVIQILTYGIAAAGILGLVISGIQYMTASGDAAKMTKAKNRIVQVVIGLVAYGLMWALLNWLIPGGL